MVTGNSANPWDIWTRNANLCQAINWRDIPIAMWRAFVGTPVVSRVQIGTSGEYESMKERENAESHEEVSRSTKKRPKGKPNIEA